MVCGSSGVISTTLLAVCLLTITAGAEAKDDADAGSSTVHADSERAVLAGLNLGVGLFKGPAGPWGELGLGGDLALTSALELRGTLSGFISRHTDKDSAEFHDWAVIEDNEDVLLAYGGILRVGLALELGGAWRARAGPLVGFAHVAMESTQCGLASLDRAFWGLTMGPSYRLGSFELSATGELMTFPFMRCTNSPPPPAEGPAPTVHVRDELSFDDPTIVLALGVIHRWH